MAVADRKPITPDEVRAVYRDALRERLNSFAAKQNELLQKQQELAEESQVLLNQVMYAIQSYLEEYNKEHNFAAILTTTAASNVVMVGAPALDITQEIVDRLNAEYIKTRNTTPAKKTDE